MPCGGGRGAGRQGDRGAGQRFVVLFLMFVQPPVWGLRNDPHRNHGTRQPWHRITCAQGNTRCVSAYIIREKNEKNERKCSGKARRVRQNFRQESERSHRPDEDLRAFTTLCSHTHHCVDSMQVCGVLQLLAEPSRISGRWLPTCFPLRARHECMRPSTAGRTMGDSEHTPRRREMCPGRHTCILRLRPGRRRRRTGNISTSVTTPSTCRQRNVMFSERCRMRRDGAAQRQPTAPGLRSV